MVESQHFLSSNWHLDDLIHMEFRHRVIQLGSFESFIEWAFRFSHVEEEARAADDEAFLTFTWCIFMASVHESISPHSWLIKAINALNFLQWAFPLLGEVFALNYPFMIMVTFHQDRIRWEFRSVIIRIGTVVIYLITFCILSYPSVPLCDNLRNIVDWLKKIDLINFFPVFIWDAFQQILRKGLP
jgi:hypothetical protein